jgi:hypothetical protein
MQFYGLLEAFAAADRYGQLHGHVYKRFVRLRPDFAFLLPPELPAIAWNASALYGHVRHPDILFAANRIGRAHFVADGLALLPRGGCGKGRTHTFDALIPAFRGSHKWRVYGGTVRAAHLIANKGVPNGTVEDALEAELAAEGSDWWWACDLVPKAMDGQHYRRRERRQLRIGYEHDG